MSADHDAKGSADELMSRILGPEYAVPPARLTSSDFRQNLRRALHDGHARSAAEPINYPSAHGVFSMNLLASVPPVVLDANRLRDDILYSCDRNTRTVLVNAANAGLIRLFAAQHVVSEVAKHSAEWTAGTNVSQRDFLARWLTGYLPLVRVLADEAIPPRTPDPRRGGAANRAQSSRPG